jgi:hypothetical protein
VVAEQTTQSVSLAVKTATTSKSFTSLFVYGCEYGVITASEPAGAALLQYLSTTFDLEIPEGEAEYVQYPIAANPLLAVLQATWLELEVRVCVCASLSELCSRRRTTSSSVS